MKIDKNITISSIFLVLSMTFWILIPYQIKVRKASAGYLDAAAIPKAIVIVMIVLSVMYLIISIINNRNRKGSYLIVELKSEAKALTFIVAMVIYAIIMPYIGFVLGSIILCSIALILMKIKNIKYYMIIYVSIVLISFVFRFYLSVSLPSIGGIL